MSGPLDRDAFLQALADRLTERAAVHAAHARQMAEALLGERLIDGPPLGWRAAEARDLADELLTLWAAAS